MEEATSNSGAEALEMSVDAEKQHNVSTNDGRRSPDSVSGVSVVSSRTATTKKKSEVVSKPTKPTVSSSLRVSNSVPVTRRNSTGGVPEKSNGVNKVLTKRTNTASVRQSLPELRRSSLPSVSAKPGSRASIPDTRKSVPTSPAGLNLTKSTGSGSSKPDITKKSLAKAKPDTSVSISSKRGPSSSVDSSGSTTSTSRVRSALTTSRKTASKVYSPAGSPSVSSGLRTRALSTSLDQSSNFSGRKKTATPESRDLRLVILPQVEVKASDDVRLDLRGHRIRSLNSNGLNLSPNLEFVYLRDNLLSTLEGVEILKRVKVLDLSFNDFKGPGFEPLENCKVLQQLYLAGNQITSLASLPQLPNLEFLSVAQNKLKSLAMASQPRLQVLAASKNKITTLKGFPYLPVLEHLRVEENPILKMPHLEAASIILVGPTLKKFNDKDLSREEIAIAKRYPSQAALCIRDGWEFCKAELAAESMFRFLVERWKDKLPSGYLVKEASIDQPSEESPCQCHFGLVQESTLATVTGPELTLIYQWLVADRSLSNFVPIPDATKEVYWPKRAEIGKILKVTCTPVHGETEYPPIFALSLPVSRGKGIPKVVSLEVQGELVEGKIVKGQAEVAWCGGTPGKCVASWLRRKWNSSPVVIAGAEDEEYQLSLDDVGSSLVFMYTPFTEEGARGEPQYKYTDFVRAAPPSVSNLRIIGDPVEGCVLKGVGDYFGGKEGPSKFEWLRENMETGDLSLVSAGTSVYTLTQEDVGRRVTFVYIPTNFEGQEGEHVSSASSVIKQAPPKVTNVKIVGDLKENSKVTATGNVTGGTEGSSRVQWFKSSCSTLEGEKFLEALSTSRVAKAFRIPLGAVDYYIVAKYTPMTPGGECGEPVFVITERAVETLPPSLNFLSITGDNIEGGVLTASYGYIGGHEGKSMYKWYHHEAESGPGTLIPVASGVLQYTITKEDIGKFISFQCIPIRYDGFKGEPRSCMGQERIRPGSPRVVSLRIVGAAVEGTMLSAEKEYWGGEEGASVFRWFRTSSDGSPYEIKGATTSSYQVCVDDIGRFVSVSCEPVRSDWARGPIVLSELIGPIISGPPTCQSLEFLGSMIEGQRLSFVASYTGGIKGNCQHEWFRVKDNDVKEKLSCDEFLDLSLEDVGKSIELVYTPVREDGIEGNPRSIVSDEIAPANPMGLELIIPDCCEKQEVVPHKTYFGGHEGVGEYIWYRTSDKLHGSALLEISFASEDVVVCCKELKYTPSLEDVGSYLVLYWIPTRSDGRHGQPVVSISNSPVAPADPVISNVHVKQISSDAYSGEGEYSGGYEGASLFSWYRETNDGTINLIDGANSKAYEVTESDYNCRLLFGYTPVRSDSAVGELKLSEPTDVILPEVPKVDMLALTGKAVEGDVLTAVEVITKTGIQQLVWSKYKRGIKYQWFRSLESGEEESFEALSSKRSCSYKVQFEDIGRCLKCECVVHDVFGRSSEPAYAETASVSPGFPRIEKLEIEGRGFHTNLYAVRGNYFGGKEGKCKIQWLIVETFALNSFSFQTSIMGETGRMYEANVDDVGYRLVVVYTPIRDDGTEGHPVSASTEPVAVEPDIHKEVKQKLDVGSVKFEVLCDKDPYLKKVLGEGNLERRILEVNRKRIKVVKPGSKTSFPTTEVRGSFAPPFHVETFRNDQRRLRIVVDSESEVDVVVHSRHLRDVIVLVIRGLAQKFNSTSLNSLLKIDA
ncbi:PREDICTED: 187-kDa microtubule-associated protein AIR9-like [Tarenaya hassleriana]|uniref:187-kDa microtubule-associated protein AIR9-like n=1 Tax=Tarenaya hassleriana TaxID=28532 RepID=UPI00053C6922|nr:PREDICTED: 187-kDa microtubule-associated protein AIR9-like [Tarenaya hassleriana]